MNSGDSQLLQCAIATFADIKIDWQLAVGCMVERIRSLAPRQVASSSMTTIWIMPVL
jgi:hypothetical protein